MKKIYFLFGLITALSAQGQDFNFTYRWRQISGPVATVIEHPDSSSTLVSGLYVPGEYEFEFEVCNDFGCGTDTCKVTVLPAEVLAIDTTKRYKFERPETVKRLQIKHIVRGDEIYFEIKSPTLQKLTIVIYNALGQGLAKAEITAPKGVSYASLPRPRVGGVYYIRIYSSTENVTEKMIVRHDLPNEPGPAALEFALIGPGRMHLFKCGMALHNNIGYRNGGNKILLLELIKRINILTPLEDDVIIISVND